VSFLSKTSHCFGRWSSQLSLSEIILWKTSNGVSLDNCLAHWATFMLTPLVERAKWWLDKL